MNPFNLPGPQFLAFYAIVAVAVNVWLRMRYRGREEADPGWRVKLRGTLTDPYKIACLRGGADEAVRVTTVSLVDRGLLEVAGDVLRAARTTGESEVRRPLEKAILATCAAGVKADVLATAPQVRAASREYERELQEQNLFAGPVIRQARRGPLVLALGVLLGVAAIKIGVALSRGRTNVLFLIVLAAVAAFFTVRAHVKRRTGFGDRVLEDQRTLFARLRSRAAQLCTGGKSSEVAMLAAVFGLSALPKLTFPYIEKLYPAARGRSDGSGGCGSSSGCGSGGCGGGGGGCGGCGGD